MLQAMCGRITAVATASWGHPSRRSGGWGWWRLRHRMTQTKCSSKVRATGPGLDPEKLDWTVPVPLQDQARRVGMGLAISVDDYGGAAIDRGEYPPTVAMLGLMLPF